MTNVNCCCSSSSSSAASECLIFYDDFTRGDSQTPLGLRTADPFIGKGWCDNPGDYSTGTPQWMARCDSANATAICNVPHPNKVASMYVQYTTIDEVPRVSANGPGQKWRILLNVLKSSSGSPEVCSPIAYYFAEYERLGGSVNQNDFSWIRLGIFSNGTASIMKEKRLLAPEVGLSRKFWAAIDENSFCADVTNSFGGFIIKDNSTGLFAGEAWYSGIRLSEKDMVIDDYYFYKHYNSNPPETRDQNCPSCALCRCEDNIPGGSSEPIELPAELYVHIFSDPANCKRLVNLNNCCFKILYDRLQGVWTHNGNECCLGVQIRFFCTIENGQNVFRLQNIGGCPQSGGDTPSRLGSRKCSSSYGGCFEFGPFLISGGDLACACRDIVDITDPPCSYRIVVSTKSNCGATQCP